MKLLEQQLGDLSDPLLRQLVTELSGAVNVAAHSQSMLWTFLTQCLYPLGSEKRYKLEKGDLNPAGLLVQKVGKFQRTSIWNVCAEIAQKRAQSAELYVNTALYVFLNKLLPDFDKKRAAYKFHPRDVRRLLGDDPIV